jgi:hypothetical protein
MLEFTEYKPGRDDCRGEIAFQTSASMAMCTSTFVGNGEVPWCGCGLGTCDAADVAVLTFGVPDPQNQGECTNVTETHIVTNECIGDFWWYPANSSNTKALKLECDEAAQRITYHTWPNPQCQGPPNEEEPAELFVIPDGANGGCQALSCSVLDEFETTSFLDDSSEFLSTLEFTSSFAPEIVNGATCDSYGPYPVGYCMGTWETECVQTEQGQWMLEYTEYEHAECGGDIVRQQMMSCDPSSDDEPLLCSCGLGACDPADVAVLTVGVVDRKDAECTNTTDTYLTINQCTNGYWSSAISDDDAETVSVMVLCDQDQQRLTYHTWSNLECDGRPNEKEPVSVFPTSGDLNVTSMCYEVTCSVDEFETTSFFDDEWEFTSTV